MFDLCFLLLLALWLVAYYDTVSVTYSVMAKDSHSLVVIHCWFLANKVTALINADTYDEGDT